MNLLCIFDYDITIDLKFVFQIIISIDNNKKSLTQDLKNIYKSDTGNV